MYKWSSSFSDELAERWDEYVDCPKRLHEEAKFLRRILDPFRMGVIVDAAMGLGCEAIFLSKVGFHVLGNEIDERLREKAERMAQAQGVSLRTTRIDWRMFSKHFDSASVDAVMILGNSLCLLESAVERKSVCEQMFKVLKPGGVFIVDQRNYDYMFTHRDKILSGTFEYSSRFMYCQKGITSRPTVIDPTRVQISCFEKASGSLLGYFDVYPFRGDELHELVTSTGFNKVDTYFDFSVKAREKWDFATLVCHKR